MTQQDLYTKPVRDAQDAWTNVAQAWTDSFQRAAEQARFTPFSYGNPTVFVDRFFDFAGRVLDVNREYAKNLAGVADAFGGAVRQHVEGLGSVAREGADEASQVAQSQAQQQEQAQRERAEQQEQAQRERAKQAKQAEREQAKQAKQAARENVENLNKAELTEELAKRDLPKSGKVDELRERLVEAEVSESK